MVSPWAPLPLLAEATFNLTTAQFAGSVLGVAIVASALVWWLQQKKLKAATEESVAQGKVHEGEMAALRHQLEAKQAESDKALSEAAARESLLEDRFATHRDAARRDADQAAETIAGLQTDLTAAREVAAQLEPTKARIGDLESALSAEKGRVSALEQTVCVLTRRAEEAEQKVKDGQEREEKVRAQMVEYEQAMAGDVTKTELLESQLKKEREAAESFKQTAETRIANLQRNLSAAEAKAAMVQKEFMKALDGAPETATVEAGSSGDSDPRTADRRVRDLEEKLTQSEAEARKKSREDGYKIAELEFRLSEAQDAAKERDAVKKDLEEKEAELKSAHEAALKSDEELSISKEALAKLGRDLEVVRGDLADAKKEAADAKKAHSDAQAELDSAKQASDKTTAELASLKTKLSELEAVPSAETSRAQEPGDAAAAD